MTEQTPAADTPVSTVEAGAPSYDVEAELAVANADLAAARADAELARKEAAEATLRAQAELQNLRRRLERDADNARKYVLEKFVGDLLSVVDSLERGGAALNADDETLKPAREGLALTLKQLKDTLRKYEVEEIDPKGQPFNPQFHEAMTQLPNGDVPPNTVVDVMQKGFQLSGRLLRPALVIVSRAP